MTVPAANPARGSRTRGVGRMETLARTPRFVKRRRWSRVVVQQRSSRSPAARLPRNEGRPFPGNVELFLGRCFLGRAYPPCLAQRLAKPKGSNCSLFKWAVTAFWLCRLAGTGGLFPARQGFCYRCYRGLHTCSINERQTRVYCSSGTSEIPANTIQCCFNVGPTSDQRLVFALDEAAVN